MACDICGKTGTSLFDLRESYQTSDIKSICGPCEKVVTDKLRKLQSVSFGITKTWLMAFMDQRKKESK